MFSSPAFVTSGLTKDCFVIHTVNLTLADGKNKFSTKLIGLTGEGNTGAEQKITQNKARPRCSVPTQKPRCFLTTQRRCATTVSNTQHPAFDTFHMNIRHNVPCFHSQHNTCVSQAAWQADQRCPSVLCGHDGTSFLVVPLRLHRARPRHSPWSSANVTGSDGVHLRCC